MKIFAIFFFIFAIFICQINAVVQQEQQPVDSSNPDIQLPPGCPFRRGGRFGGRGLGCPCPTCPCPNCPYRLATS